MNISATNPKEINPETSDSDKIIPVYMTGTASNPQYTIEVSPSITINLDNNTTSALSLGSTQNGTGSDGVYVKLISSDDFENKKLKVTPTFAVLDGNPLVKLTNPDNDIESKTLSELGVTDNLLKFGTYANGELNTGTNATTFAQNETSDENQNIVKPITATVDASISADIRKKMPNEIEGKGGVHIYANQQIGNVTFTCEFVAAAQSPQS